MNPRVTEFLSALKVDAAGGHGDGDIEIYSVDLNAIYRRFTEYVRLIVVASHPQQGNSSLSQRIKQALARNGLTSRQLIVLVLPDQDADTDVEQFPDSWVVLKPGDIRFIIESGRSGRSKNALARIIRQQVRLTDLSPYSTNRIATGRMFFGRETELRQLLKRSSENFVIAGPRRIGKSSLAAELMRRVVDASGPLEPEVRIAHADCNLLGGLDDEEELFGALVRSLRPDLRDEMYKWKRTGPRQGETVSSFEYFQRLVTQRYRSVLIVIDEIDSLIERDRENSWATLRKLQALIDAQKRDARGAVIGNATVVLCGFSQLYYAVYDNAFPFYGRCHILLLHNLSRDATAKLITEPMGELGIPIVKPSDVTNRIYYETGGMPSIVQSICMEAVSLADEAENPELTPEGVDKILHSDKLMPLENYLAWVDYNAGQIEQALLYFAAPLPRFSVDMFVAHLRQKGVKHIGLEMLRQPLDNLTLANLFRVVERHRTYEFAVEALRTALESRTDRAGALNRMIERMRSEHSR